MNSYARATPVAGTALAVVLLDQTWLLGLAIGVVVAVVVGIRLGWRRRKGLSDR